MKKRLAGIDWQNLVGLVCAILARGGSERPGELLGRRTVPCHPTKPRRNAAAPAYSRELEGIRRFRLSSLQEKGRAESGQERGSNSMTKKGRRQRAWSRVKVSVRKPCEPGKVIQTTPTRSLPTDKLRKQKRIGG